jgi:hypothetical protein
MRLSKLLLAVVGATVLLGTLVASTSARNLEETQTTSFLWTNWNFRGGFGTFECEVKLSGSLHARTTGKAVNSLIGYITEATVLACTRGTATVNQGSLPWHRKFRSFAGTLPNITGTSELVTGAEWNLREPFGRTCTVRRETSGTVGTYAISGGRVTTAGLSGRSTCSGFVNIEGELSGTTTNVGTITVRLI